MLKEKYEISLWEDYLVPATYDEEAETTTPEHYAERKLAIIGSNTMTAQWRAIEPKLVENINGTNTFTFKMYYTYIDNETGEKVQNPFSKLMVNERKVKVFWKNKWYDLVIKSIQEDSNGKSYTYTCKDLYINELSKTGFELEFDEKLGNNLGTVTELGERVVEGTDWKIDLDNSDIIEQFTEEAVFEVSGIDMTGSFEVDGITISTEEDAKLLVFYSTVINQNPLFQFLYSETGKFTTEENEMLVVNMPVYSVDGAQWSKNEEVYTVEIGEAVITFSLTEKVSTRYRAKRPVRQQKQVYDPAIEEYAYVYQDSNGKEVYGVEHTEFNSPIVVVNLLANYSNFSNTEGWLTNQSEGAITFWQLPEYTADDWANYQGISYLRLLIDEVDEGETSGNFLNRGIKLNTQYLPDGFMPGEKYVVRIKAFEISNTGALGEQVFDDKIKPSIGEYNKTNYNIETSYFSTSIVPYKENDEWLEYELTCNEALSRSDLLTISDFGLVFQLSTSLYIQEVQLFKEVFGEQVEIVDDEETRTKVRINPGEIEKQGIIKPIYIYYDPEVNSEATSWEDLVALQRVYEKSSDYTPVYNTNGEKEEKIRSITAKNSNRFNLLQQLAETFECWVRFDIEHELNGAIKLINGLPQKTITFKQEVGQRTGIGFVYGIDLKQISRTINSDKITSKVIVQPNINELAEDGICTIASSTENYSRASFILNFDYYINHGLLDGNALTKDLYLTTPDSIGYYYNLNRLNTQSQLNAKTLAEQKKVQLEQESMLETYTEALTAAEEEVIQLENDIIQQASVSKWEEVEAFATANPTNVDLISKMQAKARMEVNKANYEKLVDSLTEAKESLDTSIDLLNKTQDDIVEEIKSLDKKFYEKYSRYIQEGSWTSQDYIDPNYYYLDAQSVAYTSSRPQITYNISVLRLSALEEYKNKIFHLGDISFVEDVEFFGYVPYSENVTNMTPYREQVLVSEITSNFDSPEKDSFKVQNYKTQFEDLFQRITATTQSLSYASGEYQRAANVIEPDGTINTLTLANSLAVNQNLVISAQNETVIQDNTGITLIDANNPNNKVKLTSGGIFLSTDGGLTWKGGIRGTGISTQYLTAGSINTNNIVIQDGNHTAFRWDSDGINAFYQTTGENSVGGTYKYTDLNTFVRFDQYGVYGIKGWANSDGYNPEAELAKRPATLSDEKEFTVEDQIREDAHFGMTWNGFFMKNKEGEGWVEVSSENDVAVFESKDNERVKIGRLGNYNVVEVNYLPVSGLTEEDFTETSDYYIKNANGEYTPYNTFDPSESYYEKEEIEREKILYGIRLSDFENNPVLESANNGTLWLKKELNISSSKNENEELKYSIKLGALNNKKINEDKEEIYQVFNANNNFIIYEDGSIEALQGSFKGSLEASSGIIGPFTIESDQLYFLTTDENNNEKSILINKDGIEISNAGFEIISKANETLLKYDEEQDILSTSNLEVQNGTFNGKINANAGSIGGFVITNTEIKSADDSTNPSLILEGASGLIRANNIELGTGAIINKYIKLGERAILYNPDEDYTLGENGLNLKNGRVLEITDINNTSVIKISDNGIMSFNNGAIEINGNDPSIKGSNWSITENYAQFNNVNVSGTITAATFEYGKIQTIGGATMFRPSSLFTIIEFNEETEETKIQLEQNINLKTNDYVGLYTQGSNDEIVAQIKEISADGKEIIVNKRLSDKHNLIVYYASAEIENESAEIKSTIISNNLIIGVNAYDSSLGPLLKNSITFREFSVDENNNTDWNTTDNIRVLIGNLSSLENKGITGYGLYAENAHLTGALTTEAKGGIYAGINTLGTISSSYLESQFEDSSSIILWAGAENGETESIKSSPFHVTAAGGLYASNGYFANSLFVDSVIEAGIIKTATIYGTGKERSSLDIYDTADGIRFIDSIETEEKLDDDKVIFIINSTGLSTQDKSFIDLTNPNDIIFYPNTQILKEDNKQLKITNNLIEYQNDISKAEEKVIDSVIKFEEKKLAIGIENIESFILTKQNTTINNDTYLEKNLSLGQVMNYKKVENESGYDLFITSSEGVEGGVEA